MTNDDLTAIEAACAAATPGPWTVHKAELESDSEPGKELAVIWRIGDQDFVSLARTALPSCVAEIRRLRAVAAAADRAIEAAWKATNLVETECGCWSCQDNAKVVGEFSNAVDAYEALKKAGAP